MNVEHEPIVLTAPAKVNLYLHVTSRRPDGYHELDSLIAFTDVEDIVTVTPAERMSLTSDGPFSHVMPGDADDNLAVRAARRLRKAVGLEGVGAAIHIEKHVPVLAGLGGGSSDAAAVLHALVQMWNIDTSTIDLPALALELGADVPVCLARRASRVTGVGETLSDAPHLPDVGLLLVNPGIELSTKSVFEHRAGGLSPADPIKEAPRDARHLADLLADRENDLTEPAMKLAPVVREVIQTIERLPGCRIARMSGSGASCFGIFDDRDAAKAAAAEIDRENWWVHPGRLRMSVPM